MAVGTSIHNQVKMNFSWRHQSATNFALRSKIQWSKFGNRVHLEIIWCCPRPSIFVVCNTNSHAFESSMIFHTQPIIPKYHIIQYCGNNNQEKNVNFDDNHKIFPYLQPIHKNYNTTNDLLPSPPFKILCANISSAK